MQSRLFAGFVLVVLLLITVLPAMAQGLDAQESEIIGLAYCADKGDQYPASDFNTSDDLCLLYESESGELTLDRVFTDQDEVDGWATQTFGWVDADTVFFSSVVAGEFRNEEEPPMYGIFLANIETIHDQNSWTRIDTCNQDQSCETPWYAQGVISYMVYETPYQSYSEVELRKYDVETGGTEYALQFEGYNMDARIGWQQDSVRVTLPDGSSHLQTYVRKGSAPDAVFFREERELLPQVEGETSRRLSLTYFVDDKVANVSTPIPALKGYYRDAVWTTDGLVVVAGDAGLITYIRGEGVVVHEFEYAVFGFAPRPIE